MRLLVVLLLTLAACTPPATSSRKFIAIDSLLTQQTALLVQQKRALDKKAFVGKQGSDTTYIPNEENWNTELALFRKLDAVNLPSVMSGYQQLPDRPDPNSNLTIRELHGPEGAPVAWLRIFFLDQPQRLRKIEGLLQNRNFLYTEQKKLLLEFDEADSTLLLQHFELDGFEKMALRDTTAYRVEGEIEW